MRFVFKLIFRLCSYAISPALGFEYLTNTSTGHVAIAESIQADLSILGIEVTIKQEDWNVFLQTVSQVTTPVCAVRVG